MSTILIGATGFIAGRLTTQPVISPSVKLPMDHSASSTNSFSPMAVHEVVVLPQTGIPQPQPSSGWNSKSWDELLAQSGTPARNRALADLLEKLAASDPDQAMTLAHKERNRQLRGQLEQAALHGWARTSPTNAASWALALGNFNDREQAMATVFAGAVAADPAGATHFGTALIQQNPEEAVGYGTKLVDALCDAGNYEMAARMATDGSPDLRSRWMAEAYSKWAEFQPEQSGQAAANISDPELRAQALHGIVGGWAQADPAGLVQFVTQLPADGEKDGLLSQSMQRWAKEDPKAAAEWINQNGNNPALDAAVAAVATVDTISPAVGIAWAETVTNPQLRSETLAAALRNWVTIDLPAAKKYFNTTQDLLPAEREEIASVIATLSGQAGTP